MRRTPLAVLAVVAMAAIPVSQQSVGAAAAVCDGSANTVEALVECVTVDGVRAHQAAFQAHADANGGIREASSPGYLASVDYVSGLMTAAGYDVTVQPFDYDLFEENSSSFSQNTPTAKAYVDGTDYDVMRFSGSGDVTGDIEAVDLSLDDRAASTSGCEASDFAGFAAGNVALMQRGGCSFAAKATNAEDAGAIAAIVFNQGNTPAREVLLFGTLGGPGSTIPVLGATTAVGVELAAGGNVSIAVDALSETKTSYNVLADTTSGDPDNVIVVGAHLDSVAEGPGIQDNGSGSAAILEIALQIADAPVKNTVRFAWWGAEESGLIGSTHYVDETTQAEFDQIKMNLNFDMIGSPNFARFIYDGDGDAFGLTGPPGSAAIEALFEDFFADNGLASEPSEFSGRSDYQAFIANGIPAGGLFTGAEGIKTPAQVALYGGTAGDQYDPCYHLACDTFDNINLEVLDQNSDAIATAVMTYAQDLTSVTGNQIAFLAGNDTPPSGDRAVIKHLEDSGYDVLLIDDDDAATSQGYIELYAEMIFVSSSVVPTKVPAWVADTAVPVMTSEGYSFQALGLATKGSETPYTSTAIRINNDNAAHPLAAGLTFRPQVFKASPSKVNYGIVGGDAIVIGTEESGARRPIHFAYESATKLANGDTAPARRVATFSVYNGQKQLNGGGRLLFDAAIKWLLEPAPVPLQILAINDFHGNIDTSSGSFGGTGRADFLAANIAAAEDAAANSIFVSAGDLIGASPLISALFHDEPTIEAMNLIGLDINAVGNHEFDEGPAELLRMANGGSHPVDGDLDGDGFAGADFEFLAANVTVDATGDTIFPGVSIREYGGVKVAFIGMTLEGTPTIVTPSGVAGLTFADEVDTVNGMIPGLQADGIEAIVVLLHEGGFSDGGPDDCGSGLSGPIADITAALDGAVDVVIAGHTNDEFVCEIDGKWVTMADNRGRLFTDIDASLDPITGELTVLAIDNKSNLQGGVTPNADVTALIDKYDALSAPLANMVIGTTTADITRTPNAEGESALGDVIADAQLASTAPVGFGEAVVAFMNPGGIRNDIAFVPEPGATEGPGEFTFGEAFGVQPFGNSLVTMTLTGEQIDTLLEQQWVGQTSPRILQVSEGFSYSWDPAAADGAKVDIASIAIGGVPIVATDGYRITVNSFLSDGGDNFAVLVDGTSRLGGEVDLDALVTYFGANSPVAPGPQNRISMVTIPV